MAERPNNLFVAPGTSRPRNPPGELNLNNLSMRPHPPSSLSSTSSGSASSSSSSFSAAHMALPLTQRFGSSAAAGFSGGGAPAFSGGGGAGAAVNIVPPPALGNIPAMAIPGERKKQLSLSIRDPAPAAATVLAAGSSNLRSLQIDAFNSQFPRFHKSAATSTSTTTTNSNTMPPLPLPIPIPTTQTHASSQQYSHHEQQYYLQYKSHADRTRERIKQQACGKLQVGPSPQDIYQFTSDDMEDLGEIGRGAFGAVNKMIFKKIDMVMAVKRIRSTVDEKEQKQLLMDLEVVMKSNECNFIVQFYGALFKEGDCWICMELMDTSLDKFYKYIYERKHQRIPESILAKITVATVQALNYLKEQLKIIHRDVKPSNILLHKRGDIKLCDFGISGQLVDSIAKTKDAGCRPYMAPERIDPERAKGYDVRSDVWSLGITLMEVATGNFPYRKWDSVFEQLCQVVQGDPPRLQPSFNGMEFSTEFVDFVNTCLIKNESERPKYSRLLQMPFIQRGERSHTDVAAYVTDILESMEIDGITQFTTNQPAES